MLYKYEGNGMKVAKGEVVALLEKSTAEWWRVLKQDGHEGYVPANYCKIIPSQFITVTQSVSPSKAKEKKEPGSGKQAILERQKAISNGYKELNYLADVRRRLLADNIKLMRFYRECNEFETWAAGTKQALADEPTVEHVKEYRYCN
jgi:spectrin beta